VIWQGGEISYFSYGLRRWGEGCVHGLTQLLTAGLTHIEIFCFTHPPLLLDKFSQRGSSNPTPCTIMTVSNHSLNQRAVIL
jgi:hypothetical protein